MNRNTLAAAGATVIFLAVVALGFHEMGSPAAQRLRQSDLRTVQAVAQVAQKIEREWVINGKKLPADLSKLEGTTTDPISGKAIVYHAKAGDAYELCATFLTDNRREQAVEPGEVAKFWVHPKGEYCFQLDAMRELPNAPYY